MAIKRTVQKITPKPSPRPTPKIPGPEGFKDLPRNEKPAAAAEWVNNTTSGDWRDDAKMYDILLRQYGITPKSNPFKKSRGN
jgi:hypothetical protein